MNVLLTCAQCHFLIPDPGNPQATICRRHPRQVTLQMVQVEQPKAHVNGLALPAELQAPTLQTAFMQASPQEAPDNPACGDFRRKDDGADYWTAWRRERAKLVKAMKLVEAN
jgi:hypothetical protein